MAVPAQMQWEIRPPGTDLMVRTDDFTLDEIEALEDKTGTPWLMLSPTKFRDARAMLALAYMRAGLDDGETAERMAALDLGDIDGVFTLVPPRQRPSRGQVRAIHGGRSEDPTSASS